MPVLEAAHIKPYSLAGPHSTSNGLLLRKDLHTLFDRGYITIGESLNIEVSKRIKEDYGNGKEYYAFHGKKLAELPDNIQERPSQQFLSWHKGPDKIIIQNNNNSEIKAVKNAALIFLAIL